MYFVSRIEIPFDASRLVGGDTDLNFKVTTWSSSEETGESDNMMVFTQILQTRADLEMVGGALDSVDKFSQTFQVSL